MKALTVCQPYAHLIAAGDKCVENRGWYTRQRGWLAIHAGLGRKRLSFGDEERYPDMVFGAVVAVANMSACVRKDELGGFVEAHPQYGWVPNHRYTEGPWLWVFCRVYQLETPVFTKGRQGLWDVPRDVLGLIRKAANKTGRSMPRVGDETHD